MTRAYAVGVTEGALSDVAVDVRLHHLAMSTDQH